MVARSAGVVIFLTASDECHDKYEYRLWSPRVGYVYVMMFEGTLTFAVTGLTDVTVSRRPKSTTGGAILGASLTKANFGIACVYSHSYNS